MSCDLLSSTNNSKKDHCTHDKSTRDDLLLIIGLKTVPWQFVGPVGLTICSDFETKSNAKTSELGTWG